jgi:hypothetical protein
MAWLRPTGAGLAVAIALVVASPAAAQLPEPDEDPFYAQPSAKRLAAAKPGKVLRARPVDLSASNIPVAHRAWQLLYRTADTKDRPVAAIATLIVPEEAASEPRPILSYQPAEDSLTRRCASSYELRMGSGGEPDNFSMGLQRGWTVVVPDYEGPESQWIAGAMAGHAILDAVRASQRFREAAVGRGTPVALWATRAAATRPRGRRSSSPATRRSSTCAGSPTAAHRRTSRRRRETSTAALPRGSCSPPPWGSAAPIPACGSASS